MFGKLIRSFLREEFVIAEYEKFEQEVEATLAQRASGKMQTISFEEEEYELPNLAERVEREIPLVLKINSEHLILSLLHELRALLKEGILDRSFFFKASNDTSSVNKVVILREQKSRLKKKIAADAYYKEQIAYHQDRLAKLSKAQEPMNVSPVLVETYLSLKKEFDELNLKELFKRLKKLVEQENAKLLALERSYKDLEKRNRLGVIAPSMLRYQLLLLGIGLVGLVDEICEFECNTK